MSKIEESLAKADELRELASDDKSNQLDVYKKDRRDKKWLYIPIVKVVALILITMPFILFINNKLSKSPTHDVTKKEKTNTKLINPYNKATTDNQKVYRSIYTIQTGSFITIKRAQKQLSFIVQRLYEKELDYLRIEKIGKFYSIRLGKFENPLNADKVLQTIKTHLPSAIRLKAYIKDERILRLYKDSMGQ
jgi:hypothetical protein